MLIHEQGQITRAFGYPLKSGAALESQSVVATKNGILIPAGDQFVKDRGLMAVWAKSDAQGVHHFLSQRGSVREGSGHPDDRGQTLSKMAQIQPTIVNNEMFLHAPKQESIWIPFEQPIDDDDDQLTVEIHDKVYANAVGMGKIYDEWISDFIGAPTKLVRAVEGVFDRPTSKSYLANTANLWFQDGYQAHVIDEGHLERLRLEMFGYVDRHSNKYSPEDVPSIESLLKSFRPNFVVNGLNPESLYQIWECKLGEVACRHPKPCDRCTIPKVEQPTGKIRKIDPVAVLNEYMHWKNKDGKPKTIFGINLMPKLAPDEQVKIRVGEPIEITKLRRGQNRLIYGTPNRPTH